MLTSEETYSLIEKAKQGNEEAKNALIEHNVPLIRCLIKKYIHKGIEYDDLYQLGCLGFVKAIYNFNCEYNVKFSTYVVPMVIGEIKRFMRDDGAIKVSRAVKTLNIKINKFIEDYNKRYLKKPSIEEIAKEFEIDTSEVVFTMDSARMPVSIYTPAEDDSTKSLFLLDKFTVDDSETSIDEIVLKDLLKHLNERDKKIIILRYYRDKTQSEIAKIMGVSQVQISRIENKILEKMREKLVNE